MEDIPKDGSLRSIFLIFTYGFTFRGGGLEMEFYTGCLLEDDTVLAGHRLIQLN